MIARIWRTGLDETRGVEYDRFVAERSLPMFRRQDGLVGVLFSRTDGGRAVVTVWRDQQAIDALESASDYRGTVAAIVEAGFLLPPQEVELLPVDEAWFAPDQPG